MAGVGDSGMGVSVGGNVGNGVTGIDVAEGVPLSARGVGVERELAVPAIEVAALGVLEAVTSGAAVGNPGTGVDVAITAAVAELPGITALTSVSKLGAGVSGTAVASAAAA